MGERGPQADGYLHDPVETGTPACQCDTWLPLELEPGETRCCKCGLPSRRQILSDQLAGALGDYIR
jgi:hypothetical protein